MGLTGERSALPAARAGRDFFAFWLSATQHHTNTTHTISYSLLNRKLNGDVYGWHWPLLAENEAIKKRLSHNYFCGYLYLKR